MHNLLIVSDVHLCRLRPRMMQGGQRHFAAFVDRHARVREGGVPWRLVVNGDLLDFDHQAQSIDERGPESASLRLFEEIAREHDDVFAAFARFLAAGHEIVVIPGNHDLDLHWPSVEDAFRAAIARHLGDPEALSRLSFRPWFHYEAGRVWIEHGHQFEPDGALAGMLDPFDDAGARLRRNLGAWWIADFCPHITEIAYHVDHTRSPLYYVPVVVQRLGWKGPWLWLRYLWFALRTVAYAGGPSARPSPAHAARREALAAAAGLSGETLRAIEGAMAPSRMASKRAALARLHVIPAALLPIVLGLGVAAAAAPSSLLAWIAVALFAVVVGVNVGVSSRFHGSAVEDLRVGAAEVQRLSGVPIVVMGHVHVATDEPRGTGRYLNSGTWADPRTPIHYVSIVGDEARLRTYDPEALELPGSREAA
jgi:UDP-2,3-diacylglucosamine pyrophosphatase LpxH